MTPRLRLHTSDLDSPTRIELPPVDDGPGDAGPTETRGAARRKRKRRRTSTARDDPDPATPANEPARPRENPRSRRATRAGTGRRLPSPGVQTALLLHVDLAKRLTNLADAAGRGVTGASILAVLLHDHLSDRPQELAERVVAYRRWALQRPAETIELNIRMRPDQRERVDQLVRAVARQLPRTGRSTAVNALLLAHLFDDARRARKRLLDWEVQQLELAAASDRV